MRPWTVLARAVGVVCLGSVLARAAPRQVPPRLAVDEQVLREYAGVYQWDPSSFVYLQLWPELTGAAQLVAFDESGEVRALYPTEHDKFFTGPGAAISSAVESRIEFQRDRSGKITSMLWRREDGATRTAKRADTETREDVKFPSGDSQLAGTLTRPDTGRKVPAIILVPGSGALDRDALLPLAHFLVRRGIAVLGFDKRGVGGSTGDWNRESFDDLAGDVVAAFDFLKTRRDIDKTQIGLLGWSQAGWVLPLATVRAKEIAFVISVSGAGVPPTLGQLQPPMLALFGELDDTSLAEPNKAAWEAALKAGGNRDYTLRIVPQANRLQLEAKNGSAKDVTSLQRFAPLYFSTVQEWLTPRVRGFKATP
jgi:dienelactone hydrolase